MRLVITESQLKALVKEQAKPALTVNSTTLTTAPTTSNFSAPTMNTAAGTTNPTKGSGTGTGIADVIKGTGNMISKINPHTWATIGQIAASVLIPPPGGLIIAAAIGVGDAYRYHAEKNDKMAGVTLLLAALPGMTKLAGKIPGLNSLGVKGMAVLSDKVAKGINTYLPEEAAVINFIKANTPLIQSEYQAFVQAASNKIASNVASFGSAKAVNAAYNFAYDNPTFAKKLAFGSMAITNPGTAFALNSKEIFGGLRNSSTQIASNGINTGANVAKKL
jgi:hypothetical protein